MLRKGKSIGASLLLYPNCSLTLVDRAETGVLTISRVVVRDIRKCAASEQLRELYCGT